MISLKTSWRRRTEQRALPNEIEVLRETAPGAAPGTDTDTNPDTTRDTARGTAPGNDTGTAPGAAPASPGKPEEARANVPAKISADVPARPASGMHLLLTEDNDINRDIARFQAERFGFTVDEAVNGEEAVKMFAESAPGYYKIILMDIMMPVMDGLEATKKIRTMDRPDAETVYIVAMTANAYSQDMLNSFWEEVYDKIPDQSCGVDGKAYAVYQNYCREWGTPVRYPASFSYLETQVSEQEYVAVENSENPDNCVERIRFFFTDDDQLQIRFVKDEAVTTIYAGNTKAFIGETQQTFEIASFIRLKSLRKQPVLYAAHYHWMSERALLIHIDWLHTAHSTEITCLFGSEHITAVFTPSYEKFQIGGKSSPALCITSQSFIGKKHRVYKGSAD